MGKPNTSALAGTTVIDLSSVIMGPWATQILGDLGADVIKVEAPSGDSTRNNGVQKHADMADLFLAVNRNKSSIALDLKQPAGQDILYRLLEKADVLVHNLRPVVAKKLGVERSRLSRDFPHLVTCAAYGFREGGPLQDRPAYDDVIQGSSGLASILGKVFGEPRYVPTVIADKVSALTIVYSVLAALYSRKETGQGQFVEVNMFETMVDFLMVEHLSGARFVPPLSEIGYKRIINVHRKPYRTKDGHIAIIPYSDAQWGSFFRLGGAEDLALDERFSSLAARSENAGELYRIAGEMTPARTTAEWEAILTELSIPHHRIKDVDDIFSDPQLRSSGFWREVCHPTEGRMRMTDPVARFSRTPSDIRRLPPTLGEDSERIMEELGYAKEDIDGFRKDGVVG